MRRVHSVIAMVIVGFFFDSACARASDDDPNEPPIAGQPSDFTGAVGTYRIATTATPTELQAEEPIEFTVRITGQAPDGHAPRRPNLHRIPAFARRFVIEDIAEKPSGDKGPWIFRYRLKARDSNVAAIPPLRFVYFKPGVLPKEMGFLTTYASAIPLVVRPRAAVQPKDIQGQGEVVQLPESVRQIRMGAEAVLRRDTPFQWPSPVVLAILLFLPVALCAGWYAAWLKLYPNAAVLVRQRRSRAAQRALSSLDARHSLVGSEAIDAMTAALTRFLNERLDFAAKEPTPFEVAEHVRAAGLSDAAAEKVAGFLSSLDAARFGHAHHASLDDLRENARQTILLLEGLPCPSPS